MTRTAASLLKVLVVDDDIVSRMVLMHLIDNCGPCEIVEADDGEDAWRQLEQGLEPDIVFCDLRMPRLSGMELLERVKASAGLAHLPFVLVTSANDGATVQQASGLGAAGYIVKPFDPDQVRAQLAALAPAPSEAPTATLQRLGIDGARLLVYLGGFQVQLGAAGAQLATLLEADDPAAARDRIARLHTGCATLGLHAAAAELAALADGPLETARVEAALALVLRAVAAQVACIDRAA